MYSPTNRFVTRYRELTQGLEQRCHERLALPLECRVSPLNRRSAGSMKMVENVSRTGILIRWTPTDAPNEVPRLGDSLSIEMALPANHSFERKCWYCGGTVVRISRAEDNAPLVAVRINTTKFRKYTQDGSHKTTVSGPRLVSGNQQLV